MSREVIGLNQEHKVHRRESTIKCKLLGADNVITCTQEPKNLKAVIKIK